MSERNAVDEVDDQDDQPGSQIRRSIDSATKSKSDGCDRVGDGDADTEHNFGFAKKGQAANVLRSGR